MGEPAIEAVQFRELGPWHALRPNEWTGGPTDTTFCGRSAFTAGRMWEKFDQLDGDSRCKVCVRARAALVQLVRCPECEQTFGMPWPGVAVPAHNVGTPFTTDWRKCPGGIGGDPMTDQPTKRGPDEIDDGRAFWYGPLDIEADPTSTVYPPTIRVWEARSLSPDQARRAAADLIAAADYCEPTVGEVASGD